MKIKKLDFDIAPVCYFSTTNQYYLQCGSEWVKQDRAMIRIYLTEQGLSGAVKEGETLSDIETAFLAFSRNQYVHYAGKVAGYSAGPYEMFRQRVLVTQSPRLIPPVAGDYPLLQQLFFELFGPVQLPFFYGWLHFSLKMLHEQKYRPGQAVIMAGPAGCGKTLVQGIITEMFGGREAKPYQFMNGGTGFNAELMEAEHLVIDDEAAARDRNARNQVGTAIKQFTVAGSQRCHPKGATPFDLVPLQRLTMSLNDNPQSLKVIPPLTVDIRDKVMLFKVEPSRTAGLRGTNRAQFWDDLTKELPFFVHAMLNWTIDPAQADGRMGIKHYHNRELLTAINGLEAYHRLLEIIDEVVFNSHATIDHWKGRALELEQKLCDEDSQYAREARKLFGWDAACGSLLGDLEREVPHRVSKCGGSKGYQAWRIEHPDPAIAAQARAAQDKKFGTKNGRKVAPFYHVAPRADKGLMQ